MPRITKPVSIAMLPHQLRQIDAAAARAGDNRSQFINRAITEKLRGVQMSNRNLGTVPDKEAVPYGPPSNQHMPRGRPGSVSTPTGRIAAKTHPGCASPAAKAKADVATDPSKGVMPGQPKLRQTFG